MRRRILNVNTYFFLKEKEIVGRATHYQSQTRPVYIAIVGKNILQGTEQGWWLEKKKSSRTDSFFLFFF